MSTEINQTASNCTKKNLRSCELKISEYDGEALDFFLEPACGKLLRRINRKENSHDEREFYDSLRSMAFFLRSSVNTIRNNLKKLQEIGLVSTRVGLLGGNRITYWDVDRRNLNNFIFLAKKYYRTIKFKLGESWVAECFEALKKEMLNATQNSLVLCQDIKNNTVEGGGVSKLTQGCIKIDTHTKDLMIKEKKNTTTPDSSSTFASQLTKIEPPIPAHEHPPSTGPEQSWVAKERAQMLVLQAAYPKKILQESVDRVEQAIARVRNVHRIALARSFMSGRFMMAEMAVHDSNGVLSGKESMRAEGALSLMADHDFGPPVGFKSILAECQNKDDIEAKKFLEARKHEIYIAQRDKEREAILALYAD